MNGIAIVFLLVTAGMLLSLPRRWAVLPLLLGACYMTLDQGVEVGGFYFSILRILVATGIVRVLIRRERLVGSLNALDWLMIIWAIWALLSSYFHQDPTKSFNFRLGLVYNACGVYFLIRVFCQSFDDLTRLCRITIFILIPIAAEMIYENITGHNLFSALGGVPINSVVRHGRVRAQGSFLHPILAGTVGSVCLPFAIGLWKEYRTVSIVGILTCAAITIASASSGPVMSAMAAICALFMWRWRHRMRLVRWLAVLGYIGLDLVMTAPAYFLMARIDLTSGDTGYHRAAVIQAAIQHLSEWWMGGTDYTRHWLPTGVTWSPDHIDITNYYIHLGVVGGLPLMFIFISMVFTGFVFVGRTMRSLDARKMDIIFLPWILGSALFAHATTSLAVSYFDQSFLFLYLTLAAIGSAWSAATTLTDAESASTQ